MTPSNSNAIALIGCGNMGGALLRGWLKGGIRARFHVLEPHDLPSDLKTASVCHSPTPNDALKKCSAFVMAVKPQNMDETCASLKSFVQKDALILSIAAGRSIASYHRLFGDHQPVVRTMPNLPASIGKGMTVAVAGKNVSAVQRKSAQQLMECVGHVEWLKDESQMDTATAIVGNGPAYVFYLIEVLAKSVEKAGLDSETAMALARQTVIGGAALAEARPETDAATLRKNVTSPGGTTEAALKILMNGEMQKLFDAAIEAGKNRSQELSS